MAAVVGVIASLSLWFALHVLFGTVDLVEFGPLRLHFPDVFTLQPLALGIAVVASIQLLYRHTPLHWVLLFAAVLGSIPMLFATS